MGALGTRVLLMAAALLTAGCLSTTGEEDGIDAASTPDAAAAAAGFELTGTGCREGGGHSVHPKFLNPLPEPWVPADVIEDTGPQYVYSEIPDPLDPVPSEGNTIGNYHATVVCDTWTFNGVEKPGLVLGFVGMKVEVPEFDDEGADRQYLITVLATSDADVNAALHHAGFHADKVVAGGIDLGDPAGDLVSTLLDTEGHGVYDSRFVPKPMGDMHGSTRLWWQMENGDGTFTPIALDLVQTGGSHSAAELQGYFGHWRTDDHGPQGGISGKTAALLYEDFDRVVTLGPTPDVVLTDAYVH